MEKFKTKNLTGEWEVLHRDWRDSKFLTISVTKKRCKKPFSYMSIAFEDLPVTNIAREISLDYSRKYRSATASDIQEEASELSGEILEWTAEYIMDKILE